LELAAALGAAALASAVGALVLQLWRANLQVPFVTGGDSTFPLLVTKDIIDHGWDLTNPNLGAPFGQELYDYPATSGDSLYLAMIKALGIPFGNPAVVLNAFFLLGFPLTATVAYAVMRRLRISIGVAVVCSTLYATLPFRFDSSETHVFLSAYFLVPVCCYLVLAALDGSELFGRDGGRSGLRAYLTWRSAALVAVCLAVGSSDNYFALFTVALMAPAVFVAFLATRRTRPLVCGVLAATIVLAAVALNGLPTIVYVAQHGHDSMPGHRVPQETEVWGLSLATLVLPIEENRIPQLASLRQRYSSTSILPANGPASEPSWTALGVVGTLGLVWLAILLAVRCVSGGSPREIDRRGPPAALAAGMAFLIGTIGGLGTLFAYIVNPQLHAPDRIVVFIAFFALFGAALGLERLRSWLDPHKGARVTFALVLIAVLPGGVLLQTSPSMTPEYTATAARYNSEGAFIHKIESELPHNASIFQLPYAPFPEGADPGHLSEYEDLFGSLHSSDLRWSGGAIEGRPTDWVPSLVAKPLAQILAGVSAAGFAGIYLETAGLTNGGAELLPALHAALGVAPLIGPEGRYAFFDMAAYNRRFRELHSAAQIANLAYATLHPSTTSG
jgi:phosphoglycerol transferase